MDSGSIHGHPLQPFGSGAAVCVCLRRWALFVSSPKEASTVSCTHTLKRGIWSLNSTLAPWGANSHHHSSSYVLSIPAIILATLFVGIPLNKLLGGRAPPCNGWLSR